MSNFLNAAFERLSKFPEGEPADPTVNMTQEQAEEWQAMNEEHGDRFKKARRDPQPDSKDHQRIDDMIQKSKDDNHLLRLAEQMAKSIKDPEKAYRRALAAEAVNFHDVAAIFFDRSRDLGGRYASVGESRRASGRITEDDLLEIGGNSLRGGEDLEGLARKLNSASGSSRAYNLLREADQILGTAGIEILGEKAALAKVPKWYYLNTGDTYSKTLILNAITNEFDVTDLSHAYRLYRYATRNAGCEKLPEGPMRDNCENGGPNGKGKKKDDKGDKGDKDDDKKKDDKPKDGKMPADLLEKFKSKKKGGDVLGAAFAQLVGAEDSDLFHSPFVLNDVTGSEDEKEAKFEKGKPADPTENMSEEDEAEWNKQKELNKDKFKTAADFFSEEFDLLAEGCPDNLDADACDEWEANTEKYKDVVKDKHRSGAAPLREGKKNPAKRASDWRVTSADLVRTADDSEPKHPLTEKVKRILEDEEYRWYEGYSGRGMYGAYSPLAVVTGARPNDGVGKKLQKLGLTYDNLGRDWIYYLHATSKMADYEPGEVDSSSPLDGDRDPNASDLPDGEGNIGKRAFDLMSTAKRLANHLRSLGVESSLVSSKKATTVDQEVVSWWIPRQASELLFDGNRMSSSFLEGIKAMGFQASGASTWNDGTVSVLADVGRRGATVEVSVPLPGKVAAKAPGGLYGFPKGVQADCEACTRKVSRHATKLAKAIYGKDARTSEFLGTHAKRAKSTTANVLLSAMRDLGPKVATDRTAAVPLYCPNCGENLGKDVENDRWAYCSNCGEEDIPNPRGEPRPGDKGPIRQKRHRWAADNKEARTNGLYGFPDKTATLALNACTELRAHAGRVAYDLHSRRATRHDQISAFLKTHCKTAKCSSSQLLSDCYPGSDCKVASPVSVTDWLAWED